MMRQANADRDARIPHLTRHARDRPLFGVLPFQNADFRGSARSVSDTLIRICSKSSADPKSKERDMSESPKWGATNIRELLGFAHAGKHATVDDDRVLTAVRDI